MSKFSARGFAASLSFLAAAASFSQVDLGTLDVSDGTQNGFRTFDLSQASTGTWNSPGAVPGNGVYDPDKWVVVYKCDNLTIGYGTVFAPHPSGCPVVFLCNNCTLNGSVNVPTSLGGYLGGLVSSQGGAGSAGIGAGGGQVSANGNNPAGAGGYGSAGTTPNSTGTGGIYGNPSIIPLIGGSGGGTWSPYSRQGLAGGGAIMIAARNSINLNGQGIYANGSGNYAFPGGGSGGAVRLIANNIFGGGIVQAVGGYDPAYSSEGGLGRIRVEANTFGNWGSANPAPSLAVVGPTAKLWPANTDPSVTVLSVNGMGAPQDPGPAFQSPDVQLGAAGSYTVVVQCRNVPTTGTWSVTVRGVPRDGAAVIYPCTFSTGNQAISNWQCTVPFTAGLQVIQARAKKN